MSTAEPSFDSETQRSSLRVRLADDGFAVVTIDPHYGTPPASSVTYILNPGQAETLVVLLGHHLERARPVFDGGDEEE